MRNWSLIYCTVQTDLFTLLGFQLSHICRLEIYVRCHYICLSTPPTHIAEINQNSELNPQQCLDFNGTTACIQWNDEWMDVSSKPIERRSEHIWWYWIGIKYPNFVAIMWLTIHENVINETNGVRFLLPHFVAIHLVRFGRFCGGAKHKRSYSVRYVVTKDWTMYVCFVLFSLQLVCADCSVSVKQFAMKDEML